MLLEINPINPQPRLIEKVVKSKGLGEVANELQDLDPQEQQALIEKIAANAVTGIGRITNYNTVLK